MAEEVRVRLGTPEDIDSVMEMAVMACTEEGIDEPSQEKLFVDIWSSLNLDYGMIGIVGKPGGEPEGFVLLRVGPLCYSDKLMVEEKLVFVKPDFRSVRGGRARKLCEFSKQTADGLGISLMTSVPTNNNTRSKLKMYHRLYGEPKGAFFLYGPVEQAAETEIVA